MVHGNGKGHSDSNNHKSYIHISNYLIKLCSYHAASHTQISEFWRIILTKKSEEDIPQPQKLKRKNKTNYNNCVLKARVTYHLA